jgi:hypothetical protein
MPEFNNRQTGEVNEHNPTHTSAGQAHSHADGPAPSGVTFHIYEHDAKGGLPKSPTLSPSFEVAGHEGLARVTQSQKETLEKTGKRYTVHSEANVSPESAESYAKNVAEKAIKNDPRLDNPSHPAYEHSGTGRMMIESGHRARAHTEAGKPIRGGFFVDPKK